MNRIVIALCALAFAAGVQAQNFRWVDKNGKVQYGDTPPPGVKATSMKPPAGPAAQPAPPASKDGKAADGKAADGKKAGGPMTPKEQEEAFRKRQEEQKKAAEKSAKSQEEEAKKRQNCASAQARLRDLEGGVRIASTNEKGERIFMDDAARAKETTTARASVAEWCN